MPAYQAASLHSGEQPVWSLSRPRGLNSTLQTGWLIFMSFGRCSRSLALPGNYPADQSTARAAPPPPVLCGGFVRQACCWAADAAGGVRKRRSVVARQAGVEATLAAAEVCLRSVFAPCKHVYQSGRPVKKKPPVSFPRCSRSRSRLSCRWSHARFPPYMTLVMRKASDWWRFACFQYLSPSSAFAATPHCSLAYRRDGSLAVKAEGQNLAAELH